MRLKIALSIALLCFAYIAQAQPKYMREADLAWKSQSYNEAAEKCSHAYSKIRRSSKGAILKKGNMAMRTAECYRFLERYREANEWYDRAILLEYEKAVPEVLLNNGDMLRMMGEFEKAKENYEAYLNLVPGDERAAIGIQSCELNKDFVAEKSKHVIENLNQLNKKEFDMAPMFGDRKRLKMYYGSSREGSTGKDIDPRTGDPYMDIWVSDIDKKGNFTEPYLVVGEEINTVDNEGTVCFDTRYKQMFFTRCPNQKKMNLGCDIWVSEAKGKKEWKAPVKISLKAHDSISVGHPCTQDGKFLIFASDMDGGFGGRDLWYTTYDKKGDAWSAPVNMGPEINTKGDELFPTFAENGDLFFATNGRPGVGGLDIFRATKVGEENKWENPTNVGAPINSINNDYALIEEIDKNGIMKKGYFTSERKGPNGEYAIDLYSYWMPPNIFDLKVNVSELGNSDIKIEDVKVVVVASGGIADGNTWEGYTDEYGSVFWDKAPAGDRYINEDSDYKINISKEGYHEDKNGYSISTLGLNYDQNFIVDMALLPKKPIRLPEVRYPLAKWELLVDSTINSPDSLLFVFDLLEEYPGMILELSSHTDSRGSNKANQKLSENRAKACYKYLVEEKGVDPRRIVPVGKGENEARTIWMKDGVYMEKRPAEMDGVEEILLTEAYINKYRSSDKVLFEKLHQYNRRTEGRVLSMDFDPETAEAADPNHLKFVKYP